MSVAEFPAPAQPYDSSFERTPPQDIAAEQCVLGGMLLSKDAIADVVEVLRAGRLLPAGPPDRLRRRSSTSTAAASRPTRSPSSAELHPPRRARPGRRGAVPAHPDLLGPDRGQRRLLRADRPRAGRSCGAWSRPAPDRADGLRRGRRRGRRRSSTGRRPRSTRSPSAAPARTTCRWPTSWSGTLDEIEAIASRGGAMVGVPTGFADLDSLTNGLHPGQLIVVAARPGDRQVDPRRWTSCRAASIQHGLTSVIFSLEMSRNEITMRLLSAEARVAAAPHAHRHDERRRLDQAGPHDGRASPRRRCSSTTRRT